jgi:hypothetical protein
MLTLSYYKVHSRFRFFPRQLEGQMRIVRMNVAVYLCFAITTSALGQQSVTTNTQASLFLRQSLAQLTGTQSISDVTVSCAVRRITGSDDESGTAVLKALSSGASRVDLTLPSGPRSEIRNLSNPIPAGAWSGPDGVSHAMAFHNLQTEPAWFSPAIAITRVLSSSGYVTTYIGQEIRNSATIQHVALYLPSATSADVAPLLQHLTQIDLYLDSSTLLPVAMTFAIHPDNNALLDIPVEVRFSDYRAVNAAQVPFRVQQFINNSLFLDFQAQSTIVNTGLAASTFSVQTPF